MADINIAQDVEDSWQQLQQGDEEQAFFRCVELVQMAQRGERFTKQDLEDLMYHLGVSTYFKEKA